ncbi:hypothetical protein D9M72_330410 [compost metagenome]
MHPAHWIPVAVLAGHDVVIARIGPDPRGSDAVIAACAGKPRRGEFDGGGRHRQCVAVVNRVAVQGETEGVGEFGRHRADHKLAPLSGPEVVLIAAGSADGRAGREPERRRFAEPRGKAFLHDHLPGGCAGAGHGKPHGGGRGGFHAGGAELPIHLEPGFEDADPCEGDHREDYQKDAEREQVPAAHDLRQQQRNHAGSQQAPAAGAEEVSRELVREGHRGAFG